MQHCESNAAIVVFTFLKLVIAQHAPQSRRPCRTIAETFTEVGHSTIEACETLTRLEKASGEASIRLCSVVKSGRSPQTGLSALRFRSAAGAASPQ